MPLNSINKLTSSTMQDVVVPPPTMKTISNLMPAQHAKRQATSVVYTTITADAVYTQTATSYSYILSYSAVTGSDSTLYPTNSNNQSEGSTTSNYGAGGGGGGINTGAIIGGVIGGVVCITLIGLAFLLICRSKKRKREQQRKDLVVDDDDSYYRGYQRHASSAMKSGDAVAAANMTSLSPTPRQLVAPLSQLGQKEGDGRESKYYQGGGGYYDDVITTTPYAQPAFYSGSNSVTASDSQPSTTVEPYAGSGGGFRQVPNQIDYTTLMSTGERHVPHLKDSVAAIIERPHTRD